MSFFAGFVRVSRAALMAAVGCFFFVFNAVAVTCASNEFEVGENCVETKFTVTTTNMSAGSTFKFVLSAAGTFYVDWGDGTAEPIVRNDTTPTEYPHTYSSGGVKFIKFGGLATEYNTTQYSNDKDPSGAAIRFGQTGTNISTGTAGSPTLIQSISGSVGSVFPTLGSGSNNNQNPMFFEFCHGCSNLTSVSPTLFSGVTKAKKNLFRSVFDKCSKLVSVPENIFNGVSGSAESMFRSAFYECSALSDLPENLFSGINGAAPNMFMYAFQGTTGLRGKYIPATLFSGLNNETANKLFDGVFNKSNLLSVSDGCPAGTSRVYTVYDSLWNNKIACEVDIVLSCTGLNYKSGNECKPCPAGYDDDATDGKTDISDCKMICPAGKWTGEYEKLDYIETSGTQYIDTGYSIPASFTSFEAQFETSSGSKVQGNIGHFAGNQDAVSGHAVNFKDNKFGLWVENVVDGVNHGSKITAGGTFNAGERRTVNYKIHGNERDLIVVGIGSSINQEFVGSIQSANTYKLFSNGAGVNDKMLEGRIHWFKIYENDNLIFDFIPVRRVSDNAIGMYDQISGRFFGNDGTGDFVAGSFTTPQIIGGSVCENVGFGHYSGASTTGYGSVSTRNDCDPGEITDTETSTSSADCYSNSGVAVCPEGTYLPADSETCAACTAGNWCPGGLLNFSNEDQGLHSCATEIGTGWSSAAGSTEQTDCYYLISLNKNGYSGNMFANGGTGCSVVEDAINTTNAQLKLFYNTECTLPNISFSGPSNNLYAATDSWATTNGVTDVAVITISPTTTTPAVTTYYARKSCSANHYKSAASACSACGANSSTPDGNAAETCVCDYGYTANGVYSGPTFSTTGCSYAPLSATHLHVENKLYSLLGQRRTTPSICIDIENTVYYVSLVPAEIEDALAVEYNNEIYSGCDITNDYCIENGKLYWADPDLYLQSTGSQHIDTGVVPDLNTAIEIEMADLSNLTYGLFGVKTGTLATTDEGFGISLTSGNFGFFRNGTSVSAIPKDSNYHVYYLSNTAASIDGVPYNFASASSPINSQRTMYMFGFNHNGTAVDKSIGIKYLKIWSGNTLVRHFVPVPAGLVIGNYTVPENGMFDIVSQTFYAATGGLGSLQYGKIQQ